MAKQLVFESLNGMIAECVKLSLPGLIKMLGLTTITDIQHPRTARAKRTRAGILTLLARQFQKECGLPVTEADLANALDSIKPKKPR